jgi:hypothetical protein
MSSLSCVAAADGYSPEPVPPQPVEANRISGAVISAIRPQGLIDKNAAPLIESILESQFVHGCLNDSQTQVHQGGGLPPTESHAFGGGCRNQ